MFMPSLMSYLFVVVRGAVEDAWARSIRSAYLFSGVGRIRGEI